jgi:hypothetical protein
MQAPVLMDGTERGPEPLAAVRSLYLHSST